MKICYTLLGTYYGIGSNEHTDEPFFYKFGKSLTVGVIEIKLSEKSKSKRVNKRCLLNL